jgi:hypothetical protein
LDESGSDRRERKLRRQNGVANEAGDGIRQQDKGIDGNGKGEWSNCATVVVTSPARLCGFLNGADY